MKKGEIMFSDSTFRRRLMTLKSLDSLVGTVLSALEEGGEARVAEGWVFFTADNGFHSGQFTMPDDKRLPYEFVCDPSKP
jgi:N-acetylglucosamine-6-sulfatase